MKAFRITLSALALAILSVAAVPPASAGEGTDYLSAFRGQPDDRYTGVRR
jgi:hypothetical protein